MKNKTAKECLKDIVNECFDMYDTEEYEEEEIDKMTEKEAKKLCLEHLEWIVGNNGTDYLWWAELEAIKYLNLYKLFDITKKDVEDRLSKYKEIKN